MSNKDYYVYILTNSNNNVFYIGVTNDLIQRMYEHKNKLIKGYSEKYNTYKLVYYEQTSDVNSPISREKQLKYWQREWKINLIKSKNPSFLNLTEHNNYFPRSDPETSSG